MNPYQTTDAPTGSAPTGGAITLKRVGVVSAGKMMGALYALLGAIFGVLYGLGISAFSLFAAIDSGPEALIGVLGGVAVAVFIPVFYGGIGFVAGLLTAAIYNVVATRLGGLELELG